MNLREQVKRDKREHKDIGDIRVSKDLLVPRDLLVIKETQFLGGMLIKQDIVQLQVQHLLHKHLNLV